MNKYGILAIIINRYICRPMHIIRIKNCCSEMLTRHPPQLKTVQAENYFNNLFIKSGMVWKLSALYLREVDVMLK